MIGPPGYSQTTTSFRRAGGDRGLKPDVIAVTTTPTAHLLKKATRTVPIVMVALGDPLRAEGTCARDLAGTCVRSPMPVA